MRFSRALLTMAFLAVTAATTAAQGTGGMTSLAGRVVDTTGAPVAGAEVTLPDLLRRTQTNANGVFRFDSVPRGEWVARVRKIGFIQQVRTVGSDSTDAVFRLTPSPPTLAPVVTVASQLGLSGIVKEASGKPVPGARIRVLGVGLHTVTDSAGAFWLAAPAGSHMVSASKAAFDEKVAGVTIPNDTGRSVTIWLRPATSRLNREAHNVDDLRERLAWGMRTSQTLWTRERLENEGIEWIYELVQLMWRRSGHVTDISRHCAVVVNGGPDIVQLVGLTTDDVESVEVYGSYPRQMATVAAARPRSPNGRGGEFIQPDNTFYARRQNGGGNCMAVYVWLR